MCRFNGATATVDDVIKDIFQYNPCVGSISHNLQMQFQMLVNFNTTLVSVQSTYSIQFTVLSFGFQYNPCVGSIREALGDEAVYYRFQYNPCVGSINLNFIPTIPVLYFNTTLVSVQ